MNALLPTAFLWGPGLAVFVVECVVFRLTRHGAGPFACCRQRYWPSRPSGGGRLGGGAAHSSH